MNKQPDIIFIVLDTQRADRLSCYGYPTETSPYLDDFASNATQFMNAVAPAQWTMPTHASMFTGLYASQHTMSQMHSILPSTIPTLAERLKQAGYYTAGFSHNPLIGKMKNGLQRGFNTFNNYNYAGSGLLSVHINNHQDVPMIWSKKMKHGARFLLAESLGFSQQTVLHNLTPFTLPLWHKVVESKLGSKSNNAKQSLTAISKLLTDRHNIKSDQPIFTFINLMGTHVPYAPPKWALEQFLPDITSKRALFQMLQKANNWQIDVSNWLKMEMSQEEYQVILHGIYDAEVAAQDAQIGQFLNQLRSSGVFDNTFIVVVADHGDHLGEKQRLNHAFGVYEELTHVPLIIHDPLGVFPQSKQISDLVSTRRIFHTLLSVAGGATTEENTLSLACKAVDDPVLAQGYPLEWAIQRLEQYRPKLTQNSGYDHLAQALYTDSFKLIEMGSNRKLYDLQHDIMESTDLSIQLPERVKQMQGQLALLSQQMTPIAPITIQHESEDEAVLQQLRNLGYLE